MSRTGRIAAPRARFLPALGLRRAAAAAFHRRAPLVLPGLLLLIAFATAAPSVSRAASKATVQNVSEGLTCQCGCGLTVANCNHPNCEFSVPVRGQIGKMIQAGMGKVQIIAFFRAKYGEKVLSAPTTHGFNLLAWTMPFIAVLLGGVLVVFTAGRWRRSDSKAPAEQTPPSDAASSADNFDDRLRRKLKQEMRDQI